MFLRPAHAALLRMTDRERRAEHAHICGEVVCVPRSPAEVQRQTTTCTPRVCIDKIKVLMLRDNINDDLSEMERSQECLRMLAQTYSLVRIKETFPGSLMASACTLGLVHTVKNLAIVLRDPLVRLGVFLAMGVFRRERSLQHTRTSLRPWHLG